MVARKKPFHTALDTAGASGQPKPWDSPAQRTRPRAAVTAVDRWLLRLIARKAGRPPVTMALWNGEDVYRPDGGAVGRLCFRTRSALYSVILQPELGFCDAYVDGRIQIRGDLVKILHQTFAAIDRRSPYQFKRTLFGRYPRPQPAAGRRAKKNIQYHYDLGNDFYRLWLDENMVYTCAYYPYTGASLEEAQLAKMQHVCRKAGLRPGMQVVEAGCGWGALAVYMAKNYGVRVRAFNISHEQIIYARERAHREGLADKVEFVEDDFRNIDGSYDAFVSIGMLEHVGPDYYPQLGTVIARCLKTTGTGIIHSIGRNRPTPPNAWIRERIFPGSYVPSLVEMIRVLEPHPFSIIDIENLRLHYARTLQDWLRRFDDHADSIKSSYGGEFVRAWRLYLAGCAAGFLANTMQLFQFTFTHTSNNALPLNRRYLYQDAPTEVWGVN